MTPQQYKALKDKEQKAKSKKNFGAFGPQSFKSRSLQSFQEEMERGRTGHLMPVFNAKDKVKRGEIKQEDIPYMQRGGSWDNSDVKSAKKVAWTKTDERYKGTTNAKPVGLDWMGAGQKGGPAQKTAVKKAPPAKKGGGFFNFGP